MKKLTILLTILLVSCATYQEQVDNQINQSLTETTSELSHRFYLIGDAGNAELNESTLPLLSLQKKLQEAPVNSTVIYLGDNVYQHGLPKKDAEGYDLAAHRLQTQIDAVKGYKGSTIFIPGNHDYHSGGIKGLKRQEKYVEGLLGKGSFLPENGCPITKVKVSDEVVLLVIDTQWYLENWDNNPTMNDDCDIKTRKDFFLEFESLIKKNRSKTTVVALHHPLYTDGAHGGHFSAKQHISPNNRFPLPIIGTIGNFIRKTGGVSPQDTQNKNYRYLINRLTTMAQETERVIFASGHEHSLQYIEKNNIIQLVSGSGSKVSGVKKSRESNYAFATLGYVVLDVFTNGTTQVKYIQTNTDGDKTIFSKEVYPSYKNDELKAYPEITERSKKASVYDLEATQKSNFYERLLGKHYREEYGVEIEASIANLDTLYGGLSTVKRGGGNQSVSLRLVDKKGQQWVMRALKKSAAQFLQINAYQQKYIKEDLKDTFIESFIEDVYTTTHPYASFIMPTLSEAIEVYHTKPKLFYVPKQNALGIYNDDYGDALYMIEEHVGDTQTKRPNFGNPDDIISSLDLFEKLHKSPKHQVDEKAYIRARLFDMILGDWDRHQDQWRWSKFEGDEQHSYKPIPRDRDQVFANYDGGVLRIMTRLLPTVRKMQTYKHEIRNLKWHNTNGRPVDMKLLKSLTLEDWLVEAQFIKDNLTDKVIEKAFSQFPEEVQNKSIDEVKQVLKYRRNIIEEIASGYYEILNKSVILTASDKDDYIVVTRQDQGKTKIQFYYKDKLNFERVYDKSETKEIWLYALDGEDTVVVKGESNAYIKVKIVGGQNNDAFDIKNGKAIAIYDYKSKKNDISKAKKAKVRLLDDYETNTYDYYKRKEVVHQLLPAFGVNKDDGLFVGLNKTMWYKNLRQTPFSHKHNIKANYFISNNGFDLGYVGEYGNIFNKMNIQFGIRYTSPNYATNFFGVGNETENEAAEDDLAFNRVKLAQFKTSLGIVRHGKQGSVLSWVATFESNRVENTLNRYIGVFEAGSNMFDRKNFIGSDIDYQFKNYNDAAYPTLGMDFQLKAGWKFNPEDMKRSFGYIVPSFSFIHKLTNNERLILANKTKAHIMFSKHFEFYQGATIGANDGLRGFRFQRFTGNTSFYNSMDIRYNFRKFKSGFAPMNLGFYTGLDIGRVWLQDESSKKWHNSYGGGLWLKVAEMATVNLGVFSSSEDTRISFGLGFGI
ncbi:MAG: metallophosphoesterase [Flavobacteriaceae bacterium]|nr:metallophosphoesterase [Flavobacteriaceae bacterium]